MVMFTTTYFNCNIFQIHAMKSIHHDVFFPITLSTFHIIFLLSRQLKLAVVKLGYVV